MDLINDSQNTLNTLFKNNIDYVAKQVQTIVDFLFPANEDNSDTPVQASEIPILITGQIDIVFASGYIGYDWTYASATYNLQFNSESTDNMLSVVGQSPDTSALAWETWGAVADSRFLKGFIEYVGIPKYMAYTPEYYGQGIQPLIPANSNTGASIPYRYGTDDNYKDGQLFFYYGANHSQKSLSTDLSTGYVYLLGGTDGKNIIVTDKNTAQTFYNNNYISFNNDYHTHNTYTFNGGSGNGGGDVFVGGGAGGFVVGLAGAVGYADIEFALDSLIDDLNLNFGDSNNVYPVDGFPSYDEIKYEDMGSYYITPVKQLDTLPTAPDIADTVIDVSEPLSMLSSGFGALLSCFDSLGVTLTLTFTFLSCLVINKLRGD